MTTTVAKSTVIENIYKNFYDIIKTVTGFSTIIYPEFPEVSLDSKSSYPIAILYSPEINSSPLTFGQGKIEGTISFDIFTANTPKTCDAYASDVIEKIETSKGTLSSVGLRQVELASTNKEVIMHGKIKVHTKTLIFEYKFYYPKTKAY